MSSLRSEPLGLLLSEVVLARRALTTARRPDTGSGPQALNEARHDLVAALAAYTNCLVAVGVPIPYRMRDELRLHRSLDLARIARSPLVAALK